MLHPEATRPQKVRATAVPLSSVAAVSDSRDRQAPLEDEIVKLVQRVFILRDPGDAPEAVAFCAVDRYAGCSWVCARAAEALAELAPGRVCIVDGNLRSPSLHEHFQTGVSPGLVDALITPGPLHEVVRCTPYGNLWVMTSGLIEKEPNGGINPARLRTRLAELRDEFEYVLIDTPALSYHADALMLGRLSDGIVLVIGSHTTRRESARIAKENLEATKVPVLGAVLNKRTYPIPAALYRRL
jgi:Mrp family chromosome partitioning ATPase